ncbi:MAG TPA: hypothetical protein VEH06_14435 [Candidatus Bathyarchaeia archaeon]|nr:hypothetical protein [Candidatus Bathyarchaeia archaeon]
MYYFTFECGYENAFSLPSDHHGSTCLNGGMTSTTINDKTEKVRITLPGYRRRYWSNYLNIDYLRAINHSGIASADRVIFK